MSKKSNFFKIIAILSIALLSLLGACAIDDPIDYTTSFETPSSPSGNSGTSNSCSGICGWTGGGDFDSGSHGDKVIPNWTLVDQQVKVGTDMIANLPTPQDQTQPNNSPNYDKNTAVHFAANQSYLSNVTSNGIGLSVQLSSSGSTSAQGCDVVHGPYIYSNNYMRLDVSDNVTFDWYATQAGDWYDVIGYIVDVNNNHTEIILDSTGANQPWTTNTHTVSKSGDYMFVFISGSYDYTCGMAVGGTLHIDNINVHSAN
jgi:hypothetical protein